MFFPFLHFVFLGGENEVLLQSHEIQCAQNTIEGELCSQCFNLPCTCKCINVVLPNKMCIEDYVKGLNNPVEFQTTSIQPVKCKLSYDISDVAKKTAVKFLGISGASAQVPYLTLTK